MRTGVQGSIVCLYALSILLLPAFQPLCHAHDDPNAAVPSLRALKVDAPLTVDGILDEPFWQEADVAGGFTDIRSGRRATHQTHVRVAYTRTHLYLGVECIEDQIDQIRAAERREDRQFQGDDWVEIHLDPTHNHNSKYAFFTNPLGTKVDASEGPSGNFSTSWSAEWDCAARINEDCWSFEMSIPLSVFNFRQADGQTWGLNFTRLRICTDTTSFWSYNQTDYYKPRYFGHLTGLDLADAEFDRNLEITPYVTSRTDFDGNTQTELETGGDIRMRLTPSIISALTINPDFAQVEADADTIELRDTERFLPEKRLFFQEGEELFRSGTERLYYSRRFTDIDAGARVSGEWRNYRFAAMDVYGDTLHGESYYGNSSILRVIRNVGERSNVGLHVSESQFDEGHSRVLGTDGLLFLDEDWSLSYHVAGADEQLDDRGGEVAKDRGDYHGYSAISYDRYPWEFHLSGRAVSEEFDPVLGYVPRRDIFGPSFYSTYHLRSPDLWYKSLFASFNTQYYEDGDHNASLRDYSFDVGVTLQNDVGFQAGYDDDLHRPYNNRRTNVDVIFDASDYWRSMDIGWAFGVFEEIEYDELSFGKHFKPIEQWPIRYDYVIRFEDDPHGDEDTIWLNRVVFDYFFSDLMWLKSSIQHRSTEVHNLSVIYGWEFVKDAHVYLVYNGLQEEDDPETNHSIFVKLAYTIR